MNIYNNITLAIQKQLEAFVTAAQIIATGLFPGLTEEKLRYYVRQGLVKAYGFGKDKTYLLSEVYYAWKNNGRKLDGYPQIQEGPQKMGSGLQKAWRKI